MVKALAIIRRTDTEISTYDMGDWMITPYQTPDMDKPQWAARYKDGPPVVVSPNIRYVRAEIRRRELGVLNDAEIVLLALQRMRDEVYGYFASADYVDIHPELRTRLKAIDEAIGRRKPSKTYDIDAERETVDYDHADDLTLLGMNRMPTTTKSVDRHYKQVMASLFRQHRNRTTDAYKKAWRAIVAARNRIEVQVRSKKINEALQTHILNEDIPV